MTAAPQLLSSPRPRNLRPFDIRRDLKDVADLVELCFADRLDVDGREYVRQMRAAAQGSGIIGWASAVVDRVSMPLSGYVWVEDGELVGNLSLLPVRPEGRRAYLIANVATHPDYRRQGIARSLTYAALDHIRRHRIKWAWLQVDDDNQAALSLYRDMGFAEAAKRTTWHSTPGYSVQGIPANVRIGARRKGDWPQQREWLKRTYPPKVNWHMPFKESLLKPGLRGALRRLFSERRVRQWSARMEGALIGAASWQSSYKQADWLWLAASLDHEAEAVQSLLLHAQRSQRLGRVLAVDYPAGQAAGAMEAAGFRQHQSLIWMNRKIKP